MSDRVALEGKVAYWALLKQQLVEDKTDETALAKAQQELTVAVQALVTCTAAAAAPTPAPTITVAAAATTSSSHSSSTPAVGASVDGYSLEHVAMAEATLWDFLVKAPAAKAFMSLIEQVSAMETTAHVSPTTGDQLKQVLSTTSMHGTPTFATLLVPSEQALELKEFANAYHAAYTRYHKANAGSPSAPSKAQFLTALKKLLYKDASTLRQFIFGHVLTANYPPSVLFDRVDVVGPGGRPVSRPPMRVKSLSGQQLTISMNEDPKHAGDFFIKAYYQVTGLSFAANLMLTAQDNFVLSNGAAYLISRALVNIDGLYKSVLSELGLASAVANAALAIARDEIVDEPFSLEHSPMQQQIVAALEGLAQDQFSDDPHATNVLEFVRAEITAQELLARLDTLSDETNMPSATRERFHDKIASLVGENRCVALMAQFTTAKLASAANASVEALKPELVTMRSAHEQTEQRLAALEGALLKSRQEVSALVKRNQHLQTELAAATVEAIMAKQQQVVVNEQQAAAAVYDDTADDMSTTSTASSLASLASPTGGGGGGAQKTLTTGARYLLADPDDPNTVLMVKRRGGI